MIMLIIIISTTHQIVIYEFSANSNIIDGWENLSGYSNLNTCGGIRYFGSPNSKYYSLSKIIFDLEPHSHIMVDAQFLSIDNNNQPDIEIDNYGQNYGSVISSQGTICGGTQLEYLRTISIIHQHNRRTLWIYIYQKYGGLISLKLSYIKCQYECAGCIENYYKIYQQWKLHQYSFNQKQITYSDGWTFQSNYQTIFYCGNCQNLQYSQIKYQTQLPPHQDILIRFFKLDSIIIIVDYLYGKQIISNYYLIEILIRNHHDPMLQLNINTQIASQSSSIRDFEVFYTQPEIMFKNLNEGCLELIDDKCLICQEGWMQDEFLENCHPICGDGITQGQEECDNLISNNSCYQCKYSCIENCQICQFGICQQCMDGFELSLNIKNCISICNDNINSPFEKCYAQNNIQFDGYYKCQSNYDLNCQLCIDQKCQLCKIGWELRDNRCEQVCGDGLVALNSIEQCDDANQIQNDGCFECQFECIPNCFLCLDDQICLMCQNYFQLEGQLCQPICGDGIIISGFEDCDDGNSEPYDGCYQCQYQCSQGCLDCEKGQDCKKCDSQYILQNQTAKCEKIKQLEDDDQNEDKNKDVIENIMCSKNFILIDYECVNQCGNGILNQKYEQCDDGNLIGGDGCSFLCFEEDSYQCQNHEGSMSICSYIQPPDFILYRLSSQTNDTQVIELRFTQKVKLLADLNFEDFAVVFLIEKTNSVINIKPVVKLSTTFDYPIYQIIVNFREVVKDPVLQINLAQIIIKDEHDLDLKRNEMQISLGNPFVLSESTQEKVAQIVLLNDGMIYSMISISGFAFLSGNAIMFFNLLDLLQSLSYITYMQYSFPPHLIQFLNTFTKVSLKPILDYFRIDEILSYLNGGSLPFQSKKSNQNQSNPLNQFYLLNAKSCYFSIIASILTYLISRLLTSQKIENLHNILFQKFKKNSKYLRIDKQFLSKLQKFCTKFKHEYFSFGLVKVYLAILHQLLFSTLLQFPDYSFNSPLMAFNSINAIIGLVVIAYISLQLLSITSAKNKDKQRWLYFYQDSKSQFWAANYRSFQIYRIMFYIFIIVVALDYPQVQSILLSMFSFCYLSYLLKYKPLQSMYEYAKLITREFFFIIITGSFLIYSFEFDQNQLLLYGWIHIALFSVLLISNLIIDLIEGIIKAWKLYQRKKQSTKKPKEIKLFYDYPLQNLVRPNPKQQK